MALRPRLPPMDGDGNVHEEIPENYDFMNIIPDRFLPLVRANVVGRTRPLPDADVYDIPAEWYPSPDTELVPADTSALDIEPSSRRHRRAYQRSRHEEQRVPCYASGDVGVSDDRCVASTAGTSSEFRQEMTPTNTSLGNCKPRSNITNKRHNKLSNKCHKTYKKERKEVESVKRQFRQYEVGPPPLTNSLWYLKDTLKFRRLLKRTQEIVQRQLQDLHQNMHLISKL